MSANANTEASVLGTELLEERHRAADLQQQLDAANTRLSNTERNYQQVKQQNNVEIFCCIIFC